MIDEVMAKISQAYYDATGMGLTAGQYEAVRDVLLSEEYYL